MNYPLVSVLMTAYNREKYIAEAIESVLASTYQNWELIIVDDCSKDTTVSIAKYFEAKDDRIQVYVNEKNLGQFPNRNKAAGFANGEYLMNVDSDDKIFPDGIERLVAVMTSHSQSSFGMFCRETDIIKAVPGDLAIQNHFFDKPFLFYGPGCTIFKKSFFESIGRYPVDYGIPGDMYFNLKCCCFSSIVLIPFEFMYYRRHEGQQINDKFDYLYNNYKYMHDALKILPLPLSRKQIEWLDKKNKRRFMVNIVKYIISFMNFKKTMYSIRNAKFTMRDALTGLFH
jgi:glycosyltransferase involved in cell wall biosynthesis